MNRSDFSYRPDTSVSYRPSFKLPSDRPAFDISSILPFHFPREQASTSSRSLSSAVITYTPPERPSQPEPLTGLTFLRSQQNWERPKIVQDGERESQPLDLGASIWKSYTPLPRPILRERDWQSFLSPSQSISGLFSRIACPDRAEPTYFVIRSPETHSFSSSNAITFSTPGSIPGRVDTLHSSSSISLSVVNEDGSSTDLTPISTPSSQTVQTRSFAQSFFQAQLVTPWSQDRKERYCIPGEAASKTITLSIKGEWTRIPRAIAGMAHGTFDFALDSLHDAQTMLMYIGSDEVGLTQRERFQIIDSIHAAQAQRVDSIGRGLMNTFTISASDVACRAFRQNMSLGLEIGSLAIGVHETVRSVMAFNRLVQAPVAFRTATIHSAYNRALFEQYKTVLRSQMEMPYNIRFMSPAVLTDLKKQIALPLNLDSFRETQVNSFLGITKRKIALLSITAMGAGAAVGVRAGWSGIGLIAGIALTLLGLIGAVFSFFFMSDEQESLRPRVSEGLLLEPPSSGIAEESSSRAVSLFEQEDQKLRDLEKRCRELKARGNEEEVEKLLPELHSLSKRVQELNLEQNGLTSRDLDNIRALFTPPIESSYLDPLYPNKRYAMPNHGDMMVLVGDYFSPDEYEGFTFFRQELRKNPMTGKLQRCDVLHCKKRAVQIRYETGQFGFWDKVWGRESMVQEIQNKQKQKGKELLPKLQGQLGTWQYESMHLCSKDDLIENGDSGEVLAARDVILFFHKEIIPSTVYLEEVL